MTVTIAAYGPRAGRAIYEGLKNCERLGRQSIGGFVALAAITRDGRLLRAETQRGGATTLFVDGETTGVEPPEDIAEAIAAGLISSGPDRPEPLSQFMPADAAAGIVAGHRIPNAPSVDGRPLNLEVLERLSAGIAAEEAVTSVMARNPQADCGLIAVDLKGGVVACNSARVESRPDVHVAMRRDEALGITVIAMQNAIVPRDIVAEVLAAVAFEVMRGEPEYEGSVRLSAGIPIRVGDTAEIRCDADLVGTEVVTTDPMLLPDGMGSAVYLNSIVYRDGVPVGRSQTDSLCVIEGGRIVSFSGQDNIRIPFLGLA